MDNATTKERCGKCREFKPIVKRLFGGFVDGSLVKRRPPVLVCADCDSENARQYAESQRRHAAEQVQMIEGLIAETPSLASTLNPHLENWRERAKA